MSGAEVIGLISGIIAIVDAAAKLYDAAQRKADLPAAFQDAGRRMPLITDTLLTVQRDLQQADDKESILGLRSVLDSSTKKAEALENIFRDIAVGSEAPRAQRYVAAVRTLGREGRVKELVDGVMADIQLLSANYAVKTSTRARVEQLVREKDISETPPNMFRASFVNFGTGPQSIHTGGGHQNINTGSGSQLSGHFEGPFHFHSSSGQ